MRFGLLLIATATAFCPARPGLCAPAAQKEPLVILGASLVDVRHGGVVEDSAVVAVGGRITAVGKNGQVAVPAGAKTIDAHGKWLIPGLMDMHVHVSHSDSLSPRERPAAAFLSLYLANGVTTVRDVGGSVTVLRLLKEDLDAGRFPGPRLFFAGQILDGNPPVGQEGRILADSEQRARSAVNFLADQGASYIKVYNNITEPVLIAIIQAARARGLPVIGHVPRVITTTRAVELGMWCLEHIRITGRELLPTEEANKIDFLTLGPRETLLWQHFEMDSVGMNKLVAIIARHQTFLDPTLVIDQAVFQFSAEQRVAEPNNRMLPDATRTRMEKAGMPASWKVPDGMQDVASAGFDKRLKFINMCYKAGVRLVAGTDGPGLGPTLPGFGLHSEMELMAKAGLKPIDALRTATITAAEALREDKEIGSIETGKMADLVILNADPIQDIANARRIDRVVKGGVVYQPAEMLEKRPK